MRPLAARSDWFRVLLVIALALVAYLSVSEITLPPLGRGQDKVEHFLAFYGLALLADFALPEGGYVRSKALPLLAYGAAIEAVQYFIPHRQFSLLDLGSDALGLAAYPASIPLLKRLPILSDRWRTERPPRVPE